MAVLQTGRVWRMCPRSGSWGPGLSTIMVLFCQGSTAGKHFLEELSVRTSAKATFLETPLLRTLNFAVGKYFARDSEFSPALTLIFFPLLFGISCFQGSAGTKILAFW